MSRKFTYEVILYDKFDNKIITYENARTHKQARFLARKKHNFKLLAKDSTKLEPRFQITLI